jgi:acetolactate synthase regulatory subunit
MEWTYRIKAEVRPRVLMRVAHVFDQQMLSMRRCVMEERSDVADLEITVDAEEELVRRVHAKLYKLLDLLEIELHPGRPPALRVAQEVVQWEEKPL